MTKALRIVVPSTAQYAIQHLGIAAGVQFDDRQIVDVPLRTEEQIAGARYLEHMFLHEGMSSALRNGPNAVTVYSVKIVDLP